MPKNKKSKDIYSIPADQTNFYDYDFNNLYKAEQNPKNNLIRGLACWSRDASKSKLLYL